MPEEQKTIVSSETIDMFVCSLGLSELSLRIYKVQ